MKEKATSAILEDLKNGDDNVLDQISEYLVDDQFPVEMKKFIFEKGRTPSSLANECVVSKSYINQILQKSEDGHYHKHPGKYVIVDMCIHLGATLEETNRLLKMANCNELYPKRAVDSIIIRGLLTGKNGNEIEEKLEEKGFDTEKLFGGK